jgi:hypothetical protein
MDWVSLDLTERKKGRVERVREIEAVKEYVRETGAVVERVREIEAVME